MKLYPLTPCFFALVFLNSCKKPEQNENLTEQLVKEVAEEVKSAGNAEWKKSDTPILPLTVGDHWVYQVKLQVPENAQAPGSPAISQDFERKRTYKGKVKPTGDHPETDCFEIEATGSPIEREFVEIDDEKVQMRGSEIVGTAQQSPTWLDPAVMLVRAGVMPGESLPPLQIKDPRTGIEVIRTIQVVGRETVTAAGRDFATIRILMTGKEGKDSNLEMRKTIWFVPRYGIVREEKARYINDTLMLKETMELKSFRLANDPDAVKEP
jgi:hypothetical protein